MGVLRCEIEHPLSIFHGLGHIIAPGQGPRGTEKGDHTRQTAKFLCVHDDNPSQAFRSLTHLNRRIQPTFGIPQSSLDGLYLAATK